MPKHDKTNNKECNIHNLSNKIMYSKVYGQVLFHLANRHKIKTLPV